MTDTITWNFLELLLFLLLTLPFPCTRGAGGSGFSAPRYMCLRAGRTSGRARELAFSCWNARACSWAQSVWVGGQWGGGEAALQCYWRWFEKMPRGGTLCGLAKNL